MNEQGENVRTCPYCEYEMLFPPELNEYTCPVCAKKVIRSDDENK